MILITLKGGLVESVRSDDKALIGKEIVVNDYDADGADDAVTDDCGNDCCPRRERVERLSPKWAKHVEDLLTQREAL